MTVTIMKSDPLTEKVRKIFKQLKKDIMRDANIKVKVWDEGRKKVIKEVDKDGANNIKNKD